MDRRRYLLWTASAASLGVAGCLGGDDGGNGSDGGDGGDGSDGDGSTPTDAPTEGMATPTDTPTEETAPTDTATEETAPTDTATEGMATPTETATASPRPPVAAEVTVAPGGDFRFDPDTVTVATGETVRWGWEGRGHNVKPSSVPDGSDWSGTPGSRSETFSVGYTYSHTFEVAGTYDYVCVPHEGLGMVGSVVVEE